MVNSSHMTSNKPVIIMLGPQGSGKGTQGKMLAKKLDIPYLETGQLMRGEMKKGGKRADFMSSIINSGGLMPDDFTNEFMNEKINEAKKTGFAMDGYPRRIRQAEFLDTIVKITHAILIEIPDEETIKRIMLRAEKENRIDDTKEAIKKRLGWYHEEVEPLNKRYEKQGILHKIDGIPSIEEVEKSVWEIFQ